MERERFISGYCRQEDASRMVCVEAEGSTLIQADCCYPQCPYAPACTIARDMEEFLKEGQP